jgi:lipid-binding SYLF domain-containing protein
MLSMYQSTALLGCALWLAMSVTAMAQLRHDVSYARQDAVVRSSTAVLNEIMAIPFSGIPASMLADAHGVAIIPNVIKGGFVVGARYGRGVLLVREETGQWHAPVFITLTGGNIGWQAGVQATDLILVFRTRRSVDGILAGKFTLGADAAAAAGPVGRQAAAATDRHLAAEILSYSRSRGLFAGVSVDGSVIQIDSLATGAYYPQAAVAQVGGVPAVTVPEAAQQLTSLVASYAENTREPAAVVTEPVLARQHAVQSSDVLRGQLAQSAVSMYELLDDSWRTFLALPAEVFVHTGHPDLAALKNSLKQFDGIAADPRYQTLAGRPEFQSTHALLRNYVQSLTESAEPLQLPPPPATTATP